MINRDTQLTVNTIGSSGPGSRLLILLHGYGADENDLAPIVPHIDPEGLFFSVCLRAPIDLVPFGAAWYERDASGAIASETFISSVDAIDETIREICEWGSFDYSESVLLGFSQGCAMALASCFRAGKAVRPAGLACLSGMLQTVTNFQYQLNGPPVSILVQHGTNDPMVNIDKGRNIRDSLIESGLKPQYFEYPMQHEINGESLFDLRSWLNTVGLAI
jgi:phospholipase/carboxylesterase